MHPYCYTYTTCGWVHKAKRRGSDAGLTMDHLIAVCASTGFECEFVERPKELPFECPICLLVLREPYNTSCCYHSFCHGCIERIETSSNPFCPLCKQKFQTQPNNWLQRALNQLLVYCIHKNDGCEWIGLLGELEEHLNCNANAYDPTKGCEFVPIRCHDCNDSVPRKGYGMHISNLCEQRPFSCEYCGQYNSIYLDIINNHWPQCPCHPVECTNKCGKHTKRKDLRQHLIDECPLTSIPCEFCSARIERGEMHNHLAENLTTHISLMVDPLHEKMDALSQQVDDAEKKIRQLTDDNQYLQSEVERLCLRAGKDEEEIRRLRQDNLETQNLYSEMHQQNNELMRNYEGVRKEYEDLKQDNEELHERVNQLSVDLAQLQLKLTERKSQEYAGPEAYRYSPIPAKMFVHTPNRDQSGTTYYDEFDTGSDFELSQASATGYSQDFEMPDLQRHPPILGPPVTLIMRNYTAYSSDQRRGKFWMSKPFHSGIQPSYQLCLSVLASRGDPVSVYVRLMRGKFDDQLRWPFNANITIKLINHGRGKDWVKTVTFREGRRVTEGKVARGGRGTANFIELHERSSFVKDNALWFEVVDVQHT